MKLWVGIIDNSLTLGEEFARITVLMYKRIIQNQIEKDLFAGKVIILYGPRQVGKTTMVNDILNKYNGPKLRLSCDIPSQRELFSIPEPEILKQNIGDAKLVVLDEAQTIENIGLILKVFYDAYPEVQIIATGSSSFDLSNKIKEPLTGRAKEYTLYPLSFEEISEGKRPFIKSDIESFRMRYGFYPGMPSGIHEAYEYLALLQSNTLYKDILVFENIKKPKVLEDLIVILAQRIGTVISIQGVANEIKTTSKTVERYIDILEKMFVILRVYAFSRNPVNERKKGYKVYFVDIGLRNSVLRDHKELKYRNDVGAIFENYFIMERIKYNSNHKIYVNKYFWQNYKQEEVDYIEDRDGVLHAYECKWNDTKSKALNIFKSEYINSETIVINQDNYDGYLKISK